MADEWQDAVVWNLAVRLGSALGRPLDQAQVGIANESLSLAKGTSYEDASFYIMPDYQGQR